MRYCCCYLSSWKDQRPRQRNLLPKRNGENGSGYPEAVRHTDRYPDGTHRSSERMDPRNRVIHYQIFGFIHSILRAKTGCRIFTGGLFSILPYALCSHYLSFLSYFTKVYSRSKYVCSSLSAVTSQSGSSSRSGKYASASYAKSILVT